MHEVATFDKIHSVRQIRHVRRLCLYIPSQTRENPFVRQAGWLLETLPNSFRDAELDNRAYSSNGEAPWPPKTETLIHES